MDACLNTFRWEVWESTGFWKKSCWGEVEGGSGDKGPIDHEKVRPRHNTDGNVNVPVGEPGMEHSFTSSNKTGGQIG